MERISAGSSPTTHAAVPKAFISRSYLSVEAPPYIPPHIRGRFDSRLFTAAPPGTLQFIPTMSCDVESAIARTQTLLPAPLLRARDYGEHFSALTELERAVRLHDAALFDLVHTKLQKLQFTPAVMSRALPPSATPDLQRTASIFSTASKARFFGNFSVPGVADGRPYLEIGESFVRMRLAATDATFQPAHPWSLRARQQMLVRSNFETDNPMAQLHNMQGILMLSTEILSKGELPQDFEIVARVHNINNMRQEVTVELPASWNNTKCCFCDDFAPAWAAIPCGCTTLCSDHAAANIIKAQSVGAPLSCPLCGRFAEYFVRVREDGWTSPSLPSLMVESCVQPHSQRLLEIFQGDNQLRRLYNAPVAWHIRFQEPDSLARTLCAVREAGDAMQRVSALPRILFPDVIDALADTDYLFLRLAAARATVAGLNAGRDGGWVDVSADFASLLADDARAHARALDALRLHLREGGSDTASRAALDEGALFPVAHFADAKLAPTQRAAVQAIVHGAHEVVPYLLIGPAGCGKTRVLSEAILQMFVRGERILLTSPSEPATDVLLSEFLERNGALLKAIDGGRSGPTAGILRSNAPSRSTDSILRPSLLPFCKIEHGQFALPSAAEVHASRIIACAFGTIPLLAPVLGGVCFTRIIIDESSQAVEPEALLAIIAAPRARIVLAGDPRQLGAQIRSPHARAKGFGISLQERLLAGRPTAGESFEHVSRTHEEFVRDALDPVKQRQVQLRAAPQAPSPAQQTPTYAQATTAAPSSTDDWSANAAFEAAQLRDARLVRVYDRAPVDLLAAVGVAGALPQSSHPTALAHLFSTTLTANFRSSQALLELPSRLFYSDTPLLSASDRVEPYLSSFSLIAAARSGVKTLYSWPTLAIGVAGHDVKDDVVSEALNIRNSDETAAVLFVIRLLLAESRSGATVDDFPASEQFLCPDGSTADPTGVSHGSRWSAKLLPEALDAAPSMKSVLPDLTQLDVGVVAPFRAAVIEIRAALRNVGLSGVSVGLPANFQGQEKRVVILCTTLSSNLGPAIFDRRGAPPLGSDVQSDTAAPTLGAARLPPAGLFFDDKSLNVALTRAQSLLVLIGDPSLWSREASWRRILQCCIDRDAYLGWHKCSPPSTVTRSSFDLKL